MIGLHMRYSEKGFLISATFTSFRVFNTRRQQLKETYHVTFDESIEAIRFTNTLVDEIGINNSSRYPPDEYHHGCLLTELVQEKSVPKVIAPNKPEISHTEDAEGPPDIINTEGTHEQNVQNEQIIIQSTEGPLGQNTEVSVSNIESSVPSVS
ncbi:hypothetical protein Tco_1404074 [Tanacetum coccineum]